jgi:hypothetical protein
MKYESSFTQSINDRSAWVASPTSLIVSISFLTNTTKKLRGGWSMMTPDEHGCHLLNRNFVVCHRSLADRVRHDQPHLTPAYSHRAARFFSGKPHQTATKPTSITSLRFRRLMDRFYLTYSADQPERSSEMEVALFDFLASEYSDLVDLANNTSTIQMLLTLVDARRSQQPILDFGCGPRCQPRDGCAISYWGRRVRPKCSDAPSGAIARDEGSDDDQS